MQSNRCRVFAAVGCLAVLSIPPDRAAGQTAALTAMDYVEIQQLVNRLNFALDYCTRGGRDFAELFVEGGQFVIDQGDGKTTVRRTRDELIALAGGPDCASRKSPRVPTFCIWLKALSSSRPPAVRAGSHTRFTARTRAATTKPTRPASLASITTNT